MWYEKQTYIKLKFETDVKRESFAPWRAKKYGTNGTMNEIMQWNNSAKMGGTGGPGGCVVYVGAAPCSTGTRPHRVAAANAQLLSSGVLLHSVTR